MSRKTADILSAVMYFLSFGAFFCLLGIDIIPERFSHTLKFITAFLIFICGYAGSYIYCSVSDDKNKIKSAMRKTMIFLFFAYIIIVVDFMLIDDSFGRKISYIFSHSRLEIGEYMRENTNFIPFATVKLFINGYKNGLLTFGAVSENILGNIAVFMPFAFFIPLIFKRIKGALRLFILMSVIILVMEICQVVLLTGSADIDDYLLNIFGVMWAYYILKIPATNRFINRVTFGIWGQNEDK